MPEDNNQNEKQTSEPVDQQNKKQDELENLNYSLADIDKGQKLFIDVAQRIRNFYLKPQLKPQHFCSYTGFVQVFGIPNIYEAYKSQNLNIIEMHLKYHQFIHQKMAILKWAPSLIVAFATRFNPIGVLFPLVYTQLFDKYFQKFFIWKYSKEKIINIQPQFATKITKNKNLLRRALLFGRLKKYMATSEQQIPLKYIKFGETTQYIFHTKIKDTEQSSIYLTSAFQNYMNIKGFGWQSLKQLGNYLLQLKQSFKEYKKIPNRQQLPIFINYKKLLKFKDVQQQQVYNLTKQIQLRIRRILQIAKYQRDGKIFMSGFTFTNMLHLNKHYDLLAPHRFNHESNLPDYVLFYGTGLAFQGIKWLIKRAIKM